MNKTCKRMLALLLAVVMCFSMVPMAAFATEIEPAESEVSSALEEPAEEELPPEDDTPNIVEEILPEDIPVLYARDPISSVKADLEGGSSYLTNYGVTRAAIVNELESHRNDNYYLGTPYAGGDVQSPNGDTSYNGSAGMNCGGFVGYVLRKIGLDCTAAIELMKSTGDDLWFGSGKPYDLLAGASNYYQLAKAAGLTCYVYNTKAEMLADGKCEKGDIILMYWSLQPFADGEDNHIGFFWGESSGDDVLWHSSTEPGSGNQISAITPKASNAIYILIKIEPTGYNVTLTKTSADATISNGNSCYSLAGATYSIYQGSSASGSPIATFTTDENGHAELAKPLANGIYSVKETKAPKGYKLDKNIYTFTISGADTNLDVQDDPGTIALKLKKKDPKTGQKPQGNASLAGAVYRVTYQKNGQTITQEGTSDAQGNIVPDFLGIPFGKVTVQEIKAPEGYKLDTRIHEYNITAGELVTDVYEMEPDDLTEEVMRGGVTIEKRDSVTGDKPQGDASFAGIKFDIINKSTNAVEVNGKNCAPGSVVMTITTDNNGMATTGPNTLPYGDYVIKESSTNNSMLHTFTEEIPVTVDEDGKIYPFTAENDVVRGGISIEKRDSKTGQTPQGNADFSGITFEIVNRSANPVVVDGLDYAPGAVVATMTTDSEGKASTADDALPFGKYEVRESATNESMLLTFQSQTVTVSENKKVYPVVAENDVVRGGLSLEKHDSITGATPQGDAGFEGITFQIINKSRNPVIVNGNSYAPDEVVLELVTDAEGKASTANDALPFGEYLLHESATNESMLNTAPDQQVIISEHHKVYPFVAENEVVRGGVLIEKRDLESGLLTPLGGASLDGTLFEITNKSKNAVYVDGALYDPDTVCLTIEVKDGTAQSDVRALPYGTYSMVESKPGTGYLWTDKKVRDFTVRSDGEVTEYREGDAAYNQVKRGDLRFVKVGEDNMHRFGNVAFKLTSQTTGESHILVTDSNGEVRTETAWNPHTQNTNGNDNTENWDDLTGIWFGQTTEGWMVETQDGLCALPYDHYCLEELRCPGNEGYELVTVPNIFISRDSTIIELGTIDDKFEGVPEIGTTATINGEKIADPLEKVTLVDTVEYSGLTAGKPYTISGVLMDKGTGEPLEINGQQVTAEKEFTPKSDSGTLDLEYTFNASALAGRAVVVFETLYQDGVEVASHADIDDDGQTVGFRNPKIGTTATVDGEKVADPLGTVTITDTVTYIGLTAGKEYTVKGVLMDKSTGEKLLIDGKEITAEATFTAPKSEGSIDIPFTFDASGLAGKSVVVFESLYHEGVELAVHADIEDEGQTIGFGTPDLQTTAAVNGEKVADPLGEVTIVDTVAYTGLTIGKTYTVSGVLMDKSTGEKLLVDGNEIVSEAEFMAEDENGTVEVSFTFDCSGLAGKSTVVFETLYQDGMEVASHADIDDEGQTVRFRSPQLGTTATVDGEKVADPLGMVTITDTVTYIGLTAGKEYTVKGVLMDKGTGEKLLIDGKEITAEATFTAPKSEGSIDIPFTFDASGLAGKTVVVFESLYHEGVELAVHADIEDEGQTIDFGQPDIKTTATVNGEKVTEPLSEVTLVDVVAYTGLTIGKTYTVSGVLMDKSTGEKLLVDGKEITAETEFTAETEDGTVEVYFTFDCSGLAGKSIVVFETLYQDGLELAVHADIEDEAQTITVNPKGGLLIKKTAEDNLVEGISFLVTGEGYSETFTTDAHGQIYIQDLQPGEYTVSEVENEVTARYVIEDGKTVTVTAGDEVATVEFYNKLRRGSLRIIKVEAGTDTRLEGATFCLKDAEGQVVAEGKTDKDGELLFEDLPWGTYTLQEVYAPKGYVLDDSEMEIKIGSETAEVETTIENKKDTPDTPHTDVPKTGDTRVNPWLIGLGMVAMLVGAGSLIVYLIKKRRNK